MAYCNFVIISEFNDYWLTMFLHSVESGAVITHMVRCSGVDDPCSWSGGCGQGVAYSASQIRLRSPALASEADAMPLLTLLR